MIRAGIQLVGRSLPRRPDIKAAEHRSPTVPNLPLAINPQV